MTAADVPIGDLLGPADETDESGSTAGRDWTFVLLRGTCVAVLSWLAASLVWTIAPMALGFSPTLVMSGSMAPSIETGDVVLTSPVTEDGPGRLRPGAVVLAENPAQPGTDLLHRVKTVEDREVRTKGDANADVDSTPVARDDVEGVGRLLVPAVGRAVVWALDGQLVWAAISAGAFLALVAAAASRAPGAIAFGTVVAALALAGATVLGANGASAAWTSKETRAASISRSWEYPAQQAMWQGNNTASQGGGENIVQNRAPVQVTSPASTGWTSVATAADHTCFVNAGRLYCTGVVFNQSPGEARSTSRTDRPTQVGTDTDWASVTSGINFYCALKSAGSLWCWGSNNEGQLGLNDLGLRREPVRVGSATWSKVQAGENHVCGIQGGTLWCWGDNAGSQVGNGSTTDQLTPLQIGALTDWSEVTGGGAHTCATRSNGWLYCWGRGTDGQLGTGSTATAGTPTRIGSAADWAGVAAGSAHTCALKSGAVQCTGSGGAGELGNGSFNARTTFAAISASGTFTKVAAGNANSCAIRNTGSMVCWGDNFFAQLGAGGPDNSNTPVSIGAGGWRDVKVGGHHGCALTTADQVWCWGRNDLGQLGMGRSERQQAEDPAPLPTSGAGWVSMTGGAKHSCGIRVDRTLWCWGSNSTGQLGLGDTNDRGLPTQVGSGTTWVRLSTGPYSTCATRTDLTLWCWGLGADGRLGTGSTSSQTSPTQVTGSGWATVSMGFGASCATKVDTTLWCWGYSAEGQIGNGSTGATVLAPVAADGGSTGWSSVAAGGYHTCATKVTRTLWCWGMNTQGQVGDGTTTNRSTPVQVAGGAVWDRADSGGWSTCATRTDKSLYCWGANWAGQLGDTTQTNRSSPTRVGTWNDVDSMSVGLEFACAVRANGANWCWGTNNWGQLGLGPIAGYGAFPTPQQTSQGAVGTRVYAGETTAWVVSPSRSYEAEAAAITDGSVALTNASGGRIAGFLDYATTAVDFSVTPPAAGSYQVRIFYASSGASTQTLTVNGAGAQTVSYPATTPGWGTHRPSQYVTVTVTLTSGVNHLVLTKGTSSTELDRLTITPS